MAPKVQIFIGNSYSKIQGLAVQQEKELKQVLSYTKGSYAGFFSGGFGPRRISLLNRRGEFPTGLLSRVLVYLYKADIAAITHDKRVQPSFGQPIPDGVDVLRPYKAQETAVKRALTLHRGIISMPTGTGKSFVIMMICKQINVKTLIVVPSLEIKKQLEGQLGWLPNVTVENIDAPILNKKTDFDMLIIDEAHHVAAKTYQKLNKKTWNGVYYRFFLTATPFRNDTEETLLFESIAGRVIYQLSYKNAVSGGLIVPVEAFFIEVPKQKTDAYTWSEVYSQLVVNNEVRNKIIADLLLKINAPTLCLVKEVAHGKHLSELTGIPFAHGSDEETRKYIQMFNTGEISALIGTEGILGEGVDTRPCEFVIIAGLGKAKSAFMQKIGRAVRRHGSKESAKIVIFKDTSHKFLTRHFKAQCDILSEEYLVKPIKVDHEFDT